MWTPLCQEALAALRVYLDAEASRDLEGVMAQLTVDHCGFGTGPDEVVLTAAQVRPILARQFAETSQALEHSEDILGCVEIGSDACLIMALITYRVEIRGVIETLAPRFSFVMQRRAGRWGLLHLHASLPWSLQQVGESFPVAGLRANLEGWINAPIPVFWNVAKK